MSLEHFNLADLSPTTGDVPVSDEYKVEWVKAKAEFKRKKSAALTADVCDKSQKSSGPTVAFALQSSDSSHSSDSGQSLNESGHSYESSLSQETRSSNKPEQLEPCGMSSKLDVLQGVPFTTSSGSISGLSLSRPASLKISSRLDSLSSGHINTNDALSTSSVTTSLNSLTTQLSSVDTEPKLSTSVQVEGHSQSAHDISLHSSSLVDIGAVYGPHFDVTIQETPASDDVKSTVAAMKSIFERDAKLRSVSDQFSFGSNENLTFGTTLKSSHSSPSLTKTEKKEFGALTTSNVNVMEKKKK